MIRLSGPGIADAGTEVCVTAHNIGLGFKATVVSGGRRLKVKTVIDPASHSAEICFTIPAGSEGVEVGAVNSATTEPVNLIILT